MNAKKLIALLLAVLTIACMLTACGGGSDSDLKYIQNKGTMTIGVTVYAPMNYEENGKWTGFDTEFAEAVCKELGVEAEFIVIDWGSKIMELDAKSIDCVWNGMTITDEVKNGMNVTDPYVKNAQVVVMAKDQLDAYKSADDMKDLAFSVETGSTGEDAAEEAGFANVTAVDDMAMALMEVASGAADATIIDITMANAMTGEGTSYADLGYAVELSTEEYGIGFRKGSDVTAKVNEIMKKLKDNGTLTALAEKYQLTLAF